MNTSFFALMTMRCYCDNSYRKYGKTPQEPMQHSVSRKLELDCGGSPALSTYAQQASYITNNSPHKVKQLVIH